MSEPRDEHVPWTTPAVGLRGDRHGTVDPPRPDPVILGRVRAPCPPFCRGRRAIERRARTAGWGVGSPRIDRRPPPKRPGPTLPPWPPRPGHAAWERPRGAARPKLRSRAPPVGRPTTHWTVARRRGSSTRRFAPTGRGRRRTPRRTRHRRGEGACNVPRPAREPRSRTQRPSLPPRRATRPWWHRLARARLRVDWNGGDRHEARGPGRTTFGRALSKTAPIDPGRSDRSGAGRCYWLYW